LFSPILPSGVRATYDQFMRDRRHWLRRLHWPVTALGLIIFYGSLVLDFLQLRTLGFSLLVWMAVGTSLIVIMAAIWIYGLSRENAELQQRLAPALEITFDPSAPLFIHRGKRFISFPNPIQTTLYRVRVGNLSSVVSIDEVRVRILQIDPPLLRSTWPLREMADETGETSRAGFTLHPGEKRYIDLVMREGHQGRDFAFSLAAPRGVSYSSSDDRVPVRRYQLMLVAEGRNVPPCKASFTLDRSPDDEILLQPI